MKEKKQKLNVERFANVQLHEIFTKALVTTFLDLD